MKILSVSLLTLATLAVGVCRVRAGIVDVWALGESEKVLRYQDNHPAREGSLVWDGSVIRLRGLYNEILGFQVIVVADSVGARSVELAVTAPANKDGQLIGGQGTLKYGPSGTIEIFSQHYLHVARSNEKCWFWGSTSVPEHLTGWFPDALITADARPGSGGMPLDIPPTAAQVNRRQNTLETIPRRATRNQGFWVDVHLPRDRSFSPGTYNSTVTIFSAGRIVKKLPLEVTLLDAYLPDENHSTVWLFGSVGENSLYFPGLSEAQVETMLKHISHRHRVDFTGGSAVHSSRFDESMMERYSGWLDGSAFTPAMGYRGPGEGHGEKLFPVGMYGSITNTVMTGRDAVRAESDKWVNWFERNAPEVRYFWYLVDEPGPVQFPWITERAGWVHGNSGPGSRLPVFTTRNFTPELADAIDLWASNKGVDMDALPGARGRGGDIWFYNGLRPLDGTVTLEAEAVDFRVKGWIKYRYGLDTWFLWEGTQWRHNRQGPKGNLHQRLFSEPATFINWTMNYANGNGIVYYPGRMPFYPEEDRGVEGLFGSIRLKNIRRGQQDYELMWLAAGKAGSEAVKNIVWDVVPRALEDVSRDETLPWPLRGNQFDLARDRLLDLIVR